MVVLDIFNYGSTHNLRPTHVSGRRSCSVILAPAPELTDDQASVRIGTVFLINCLINFHSPPLGRNACSLCLWRSRKRARQDILISIQPFTGLPRFGLLFMMFLLQKALCLPGLLE